MDNPWKTSEQQDESGKEGVDLGPGAVFKIFEVKEEMRWLTLEEAKKYGRISEISAEMKRAGKGNICQGIRRRRRRRRSRSEY